MKTEQQVIEMKAEISRKIDAMGEKARSVQFGSAEWQMYDREYAKYTAQYNILLEVLK